MKIFINRAIAYMNRKFHFLYFGFCSLVENFYLRLIGVQISGGMFRGWTSFFIDPKAKIVIGSNATFNSCSYTNHIGLNHRCIIGLHANNAYINIGKNFGMSSSTINCWKSIVIGDDVRIGANCIIMDADFHLDDPRVGNPKEILIEDNVWLGANVVVLKGVHIGTNTIIGMNSIVTKDIPANCIAAGNPCKIIKKYKSYAHNIYSR